MGKLPAWQGKCWFRPQAAVLESLEHLIAELDSGMNTFSGGEALEEEFFYPWPFPHGVGSCLTRNTAMQSELMDIALACLDLPCVQAGQTS